MGAAAAVRTRATDAELQARMAEVPLEQRRKIAIAFVSARQSSKSDAAAIVPPKEASNSTGSGGRKRASMETSGALLGAVLARQAKRVREERRRKLREAEKVREQQRERQRAARMAAAQRKTEVRLKRALDTMRLRRELLSSQPGVQAAMSVPLRITLEDETERERAIESLKEAIADASSEHKIATTDIDVKLKSALQCLIKIRGTSSVRAVCQNLIDRLSSHDSNRKLRAALENCGADAEAEAQVAPQWPLERIQKEIELRYCKTIPLEALEELVQAVARSSEVFSQVWEQTCEKLVPELELLLKVESRQSALVKQGASEIDDLLTDARNAQLKLKARLAPGTAWAESDLSDDTISQNDPCRVWLSKPSDSTPEGSHKDPGIKSRKRMLQKAKACTSPLLHHPVFEELVDISRMAIVFDSISCLYQSMQWILSNFDVVWLDNRFRNPTCLGYRDINIGVRQHLSESDGSSTRQHISEMQLLDEAMFRTKQGEGHKLYETVRATLCQFEFPAKDHYGVQKLILRTLDGTEGQIMADASNDLARVADVCLASGPLTAEVSKLGVSLTHELMREAKDAQIPESLETWISVVVETAANFEKIEAEKKAIMATKIQRGFRRHQKKKGMSFKFLRFTPIKVRSADHPVQISEISFKCDGSGISMNGAVATNPGGTNRGNEGPQNAIDGSTRTKWLDDHVGPLIIEFTSSVRVDSFSFTTANDAIERDPVRWTLQGSTNGTLWIDLHRQVEDFPTPTQRFSQTPWFECTGSTVSKAIGISDGHLGDDCLSASSVRSGACHAGTGRLHRAMAGWAPERSNMEMCASWIKVHLPGMRSIGRIATQGHGTSKWWTTGYTVSYSVDGISWIAYMEDGAEKHFAGNRDRHCVVEHVFVTPISCRFIKVHPKTWHSHPAIRLELYESS